jgi:hypothetical protein
LLLVLRLTLTCIHTPRRWQHEPSHR